MQSMIDFDMQMLIQAKLSDFKVLKQTGIRSQGT